VSQADIAEAVARLDALTRRLRRECPWDREQNERTIVPHTVEEAYELADAAQRGDDRKLLDELGDVLFQVHFLSLLLEERGAGDLAEVAEHCRQKLIRRHPHVFGDVAADSAGPEGPRSATLSAGEVLRNWDAIKADEEGREPGIFGDVPENLPALLYARKLQRRAASAGRWPSADDKQADAESFRAVGDELLALVDRARRQRVDPELALRAAADRFREEIGER
jgi:nucleoside triphosphate diphosphatase